MKKLDTSIFNFFIKSVPGVIAVLSHDFFTSKSSFWNNFASKADLCLRVLCCSNFATGATPSNAIKTLV